MTRATVLQEVRQMRFEELYERRQRRALTMAEAAEILGVTERTFRRWRDRYEADGAEGLQDRRLGCPSGRAVPVDEVLRMVTRYQTRYTGWTVSTFTSAGSRSMAGRGPIPGRRKRYRRPERYHGPHGAGRIVRNGRAHHFRE